MRVLALLVCCLLGGPVAAERPEDFHGESNLDVDEAQDVALREYHKIQANATVNTSVNGRRAGMSFLHHVIRALKSEKSHTKLNNAGVWHLTSVVLMQKKFKSDEVFLDILGFSGLVNPMLLAGCAVAEMHDNVQDRDWCRFGVNGIHFFVQMGSLGTALTANACGLPVAARIAVSGTTFAWAQVYDWLRTKCGRNELREQRVPLLSQCYDMDVGPEDEDEVMHQGFQLERFSDDDQPVDIEPLGEETYNPLHIRPTTCGHRRGR
eukprot:TRINITY_DN94297_c0_g1_i1.p1 TRINITY_DN94297_c0_g1~~TRINITY_DN94297_c0_g1_i1.p1  ORF type:complete len:265 (-),score=31.29 TRINITY_DN94297_c0_g1_i1:160-954(-)